jgi:DnaD/phage-associated family protein
MNKISLHAEGISDVTIVPNTFIDQFMPSANGAYVKVYLFLLRCFTGNCPEVSISSIADHLDNTEKDITRALTYWEKLNLLVLTRNTQKDITEINLVDISTSSSDNTVPLPSDSDSDLDSELDEVAVSIHIEEKPAARQSYSAEKITQLTNNDEIKWAMHIVEIYLDRPLKPMDLQLILYLYEELHFSAELIMYLYEYCVSKNKKNASYIEAVALTWAEGGIDTEEKAKEAANTYNDHFNIVNKAFGLNRAPGQIERQYITKWVEVFHFSDEIITEACNRTILRTQKPDFKYTDKILETWFKKDAKDLADIARLDEEFNKANKTFNTNKVTAMVKPSTNKFNQFPQRTYTAQDYAELERKLLNKGL